MKSTILTPLIILLLTISSNVNAQQQEKEYTYQVKIVNSKGKPQPDIYAYYETNDKGKRYFKSDSNGIMTITSTDVYLEMNIDPEKSKGYHRTFFNFYHEPKGDVVYDTKKEIDKALKGEAVTICQEMPEYPGGMHECMRFLNKKVWEHPIIAKENSFHANRTGIPEMVIIQFIIDKKGNIKFPAVVKGLGSPIDQAAIDVLLAMPRWKPGMQKGKPVNCLFAIPVRVLFI